MIKLLTLRAFILAVLITCSNAVQAQDSIKRKAPAKPATVAPKKYTPYVKPATAGSPAVNSGSYRQPAAPAAPVDKSLRGQYQYLLTKVYNYQQPLVSALVKNYNDTLSTTRKQLKAAQATLAQQAQTIDTLKATANNKDQSLVQAQAKVDEVSLLGIPMKKTTYNWIMWGLVIVFGAVAAIVLARSGAHSREAKYRIKLYNELDEEYKTYKAKANEKEKKLARELQTERNKLDELLGNS
ncbi:hypothetical protein FPZ43_14715 [Mucilaginibacter pallidiroseus]|uniref:Uncharacterized protein n=1 Tax=Mucilaginibacter pallidiroseus TaxID=2599295 RepID=A0A563U4W3_9SPHI|nr:hypothetical protein [Mucilaginibacter pallidiroseus]TWR26414.1 hypothetical protein FPZ43_14715 [Mucilaginibacter pallidiroseus]